MQYHFNNLELFFYYIFKYFPVYYVIFAKKNYKYVEKSLLVFQQNILKKRIIPLYSVLSDIASSFHLVILILFPCYFFYIGLHFYNVSIFLFGVLFTKNLEYHFLFPLLFLQFCQYL